MYSLHVSTIAVSTIADAILDRLVHNAHEFALTGPSQRGERTTPTKK